MKATLIKLGSKTTWDGKIVEVSTEKDGIKAVGRFDTEAVWKELSTGDPLDRAGILAGAAQAALHRPGGGGGIEPFRACRTAEDWADFLAARASVKVTEQDRADAKEIPVRLAERVAEMQAKKSKVILVYGKEYPLEWVTEPNIEKLARLCAAKRASIAAEIAAQAAAIKARESDI